MHEKIKNIEKNSCIDYERFRRDHHYMMFLLLVLDAINMRRAQNTAFRKVTRFRKYTVDNTRIKEEDRSSLERRNIGYRTFKNIRGTAPYFEHQKSRLFAFLRQKGPPTIFTTITSAEYDWISLMENIIKAKPDVNRIEDFINTLKNRNNLSHLLNLENKEDLRNHAGEIIKNMEGAEMSKLVNDHIVHTTKGSRQNKKNGKTWEFFPTGEGGLKQNLLFSQPVVGKKEGGSSSVIEFPTYFYLRNFTLQRNILTKF